ncbi:hypothetical protein FPSE5266_01743 [Fusarium pseudograminearum]|nr:hypothetical protein FPSE5266_01743 [Fusarium pseudograminearum]
MSSNTPNDPEKESDGSNGRRPNPNQNSNVLRTEDMGIHPVVGGGDDGLLFDNLSDPTALLIFINGQGIKIPRNGDPPTEDPRNADYVDLENVQRAVDNMEASLNNVSNRQNPQSSAPVISPQRAVKRERQDSDKAQPEARASKKCRQGPEAQQGVQAPDDEALRARHTGIQRPDCQYPNPMPHVNRSVQQGTGPRECRAIVPNVRRRIEWGVANSGPGGFDPQAIPVNNLPPWVNNLPPEMNNLMPQHLHQMGPQIPPQVPIMNGGQMHNTNIAHAPHEPRQWPPIPQMPGMHQTNYEYIPNTIGAPQQPMMPMPQMGPQWHHMNGGHMYNTDMVHIPYPAVMPQHMHQMGPQIPPHAPPQWPPIPQMPGMNGNMHHTNLVHIPNSVGAPQQPMMPMPQMGPQMGPQMPAQVPGMNGEHMLQSNGMPGQMRPRHVRPGHTQSGQRPTGQRPTGQGPTGQRPTGQGPTGLGPTGQGPTGQRPPRP